MTIHDIYILRQILRPMGLTLMLALLVLLIERMLRLLDLVLGSQGPLGVVFEILTYLVPHYMGLALPVSLFIGVLLGFSRLSRDGEIDALHSARIGLERLLRPTLFAACVLSIIAAVTVSHLKPYGRYAYQSMVFAITNASFHAFLRAGVFNKVGDMTFLIEDIQPDGARFTGAFIYEEEEDGDVTVIAAQHGKIGYERVGAPPTIRLYDGVRLTVRVPEPGRTEQDPSSIEVLQFEELQSNLGVDAVQLFRPRGNDERELTLFELWERRNDPPPGVGSSDLIAEFHGRIVSILSVPVLPFLAIPLALGRRRSERSLGIAIGIVILIVYSHVLDLGENMAESQVLDPWLAIWVPFLIFAASSGVLFYRTARRVPSTPSFQIANYLAKLTEWIGRRSASPEEETP